MVLLFWEVLARASWPIGVIENTEKSGDGLVRTATVHTVEGFARRDVGKLCLTEKARIILVIV